MAKAILAFLVLTVIFASGIHLFVSLKSSEKWKLTKVVAYAMLCSLFAVAFLTGIVILF